MMDGSVNFSFPASREYAIFLHMAVAGAAAALDAGVDALEDLCAAAEEALDCLLVPGCENETVCADLYRKEDHSIALSLRFAGRAGTPCDTMGVSEAILKTLMNDVTLFSDARGCTAVRMTLRAGC